LPNPNTPEQKLKNKTEKDKKGFIGNSGTHKGKKNIFLIS